MQHRSSMRSGGAMSCRSRGSMRVSATMAPERPPAVKQPATKAAVPMRQLGAPSSNGSGSSSSWNGNGGSSNGTGASSSGGTKFSSGTGGSSSSSFGSSSSSSGSFSSSGNGNGNGNGRSMVLARAPVQTVPAVRAAASEVATSLAGRRQLQRSLQPQEGANGYGSGGIVVDVEAAVERPSDMDFKWAQDNYNATQRTVDTWTFFTVFRTRLWLLDQKWSYIGGFTEEKKKKRTRGVARYLLDSVLNLGPTFIKIGQLSSTRSDLFPAEFIEELTFLQDRVPAFSYEKAAAIIESDLGRPVSELFRTFERRPIAAASLGQVHRATLWDGTPVAVKVQRPGLKQLFDIDLNNLRILAEQLDKGDENRDFKGIYQECATVLYQEIDYINEGRNADRFRRNFARDGLTWVRVPTVHWQYCSTRILTLEYLPGVKISDKAALASAGLDLDLVARRATEAYLQQILRHGFFHADPHPGNVSVDPATGSLLFYDFGMMGEIVPGVRERLLDVFYGVYRKDSGQVIDALVALGVIKPTGDLLSVRRAINYFITNIVRQAERDETIAAIGEDLFAIAVDQPFRFPATFTFVLRAFSTLEGIGKTLNPNYKFQAVATPYAQELLDLQGASGAGGQGGALLAQVQAQASDLTSAAAAMPFAVRRIDSVLSQLEGGDLKLRVRALEAERAGRRSGVMQAATINTIACMGLLNMGTMLALNGVDGPATACMALAAVFSFLTFRGFKRVQRLDEFERQIKG